MSAIGILDSLTAMLAKRFRASDNGWCIGRVRRVAFKGKLVARDRIPSSATWSASARCRRCGC